VVPVVDEAALSLLNRFPAGGTGLAAIALYNGQHNGMTSAELSKACKAARLPSSGAKHDKLVFLWAHVKDPERMQRLVHVHKKSELLALLQPCYEREMVEGLVEVQLALEEMVDVVCECEREGGEGGGVLDAWSLGAEKEKGKKKRKRAPRRVARPPSGFYGVERKWEAVGSEDPLRRQAAPPRHLRHQAGGSTRIRQGGKAARGG
jgi:hypothetical protein